MTPCDAMLWLLIAIMAILFAIGGFCIYKAFKSKSESE